MPKPPTRTTASCEIETKPGPEQAVRDGASVHRRLVRVLERGRDSLRDQERVLGRNADAEGAHAREHGVERPAGGLVPGHERDVLDEIELGPDHDRVVGERQRPLSRFSPTVSRIASAAQLLRLENAQADEAALVRRIERPEHRAERILRELRDEQVVAEVTRQERSGSAHAANPAGATFEWGSRRPMPVLGADISSFVCGMVAVSVPAAARGLTFGRQRT